MGKAKRKARKNGALRWLYDNSKGQRWNIACLILSNALFSVLSVLFAFAVREIVDGATKIDKNKLIFGVVLIISIVILQFAFRIITNSLSECILGKIEMNIKSKVFATLLSKRYKDLKEYHSGDLMTRLTQDITVVSDGIVSIVPSVVAASVRLICAVVALIILNWVFAVAFVVAGALVFLVTSVLRGKLKSLHKKSLETDGKVRSFMQECLENVLALKIFSVNKKIVGKADALQQNNFNAKMKRKNYSVFGNATFNLIFSAGYVFALIYGGICIFQGLGLTYGDLSAILQLVNNVQVPFASLSGVFPKYYAMTASAERLMELEALTGERTEYKIDVPSFYSKLKSIKISNASFSYDRDFVLKNADAEIEKGDFVAIVGASGIGKSTLLKLLLGVYDLDSGEIVFDLGDEQVNVDNTIRPLFSYVPQGNMLFSGSLYDNVTFINGNAGEDKIQEALNVACVSDFLGELPDGLQTKVGENGVGLSEGQIQRIAIARAILCDAPIILLDEATSALDENTELKVLDNLKRLNDKTIIIITHRKAVLSICNKKIKIEKGKINLLPTK